MARSFDMVAEYLGTVAQVHSAFCSKDYWLDRLAEGRADVSTLDSFAEDGHGGTDITTTQTMRAAGLPASSPSSTSVTSAWSAKSTGARSPTGVPSGRCAAASPARPRPSPARVS